MSKRPKAKIDKEVPHPKGGRQPAHHYKLSEKDHPLIMEALGKFIPVYVLAKKIRCDYHTLLNYIHAHPELEQCQKDADDNMVAFAKGKLMSKVSAGHAASIMFLLERLDRKHFGRYNVIENVGDLPSINIGVFKEEDFVKPVEPSEVSASGNAADILKAAAEMADRQAALEEQELEESSQEGDK